MKRIIAALVLLCLLIPSALAAPDIDLSGMSLSELLDLQDQLTAALWASDEWQTVTVPVGTYLVGRDIPAGQWSISATDGSWAKIQVAKNLSENGIDVGFSGFSYQMLISESYQSTQSSSAESVTWSLVDGIYFQVVNDSVVFSRPVGLGFVFE